MRDRAIHRSSQKVCSAKFRPHGGCTTPHWMALHERAFEKQLHGESCELTASLPSPRLTGKAREAHGDEAMLAFG